MAELRMSGSSTIAPGEVEVCSVWKGENESDPELVENYDTDPLADAGTWTEDEAYCVYRRKLVRLRDLYVGQLSHLRHMLQEKRRHFLLQWHAEGGGRGQDPQSSRGGSLEDAAYRCYRKRSGEEGLLERKQKQRRIEASIELFSRRESRETHKTHYQHLLNLHQQYSTILQPLCVNNGCGNKCLPFASRCPRHICDDPKQLLYVRCSYVYQSGAQCSNPVPHYWEPTLCGGHCDNVSPPDFSSTDDDGSTVEREGETGERPSDRSKDEDSLLSAEGGTERTDKTVEETQDTCR